MVKKKKRSDGLYQLSVVVYERGVKKRKYFYGKTQQEAKRKMLAYQEQIAAGRSFAEVATEWRNRHWEEIAAGTQTCYAPAFDRALTAFDGLQIKKVIPLDVRRAVHDMANQGYAQHSVTIYLSVLNQIFDHAILMGDLSENPAASVKVPKGLQSSRRECPDEHELELVREHVDDPFGLFAYFLLYSGLRRGELLALQWRDIDFGRRTISVTKSVTYAGTGNTPEIKSTKTEAGEREVILLDRLAVKLFQLQKSPQEFVFGGAEPLTQAVYRRAWKRYCMAAGLWKWTEVQTTEGRKKVVRMEKKPSITPHQLRHAFATMCYEMGIDAKDAQQLLGHSKIEVTMDTYTHIRKSRRSDVADKLNRAE